MTIVYCGVCPHPPIVVPEVGGDEASLVSDTQEALLELGRRLKKSGADTVVIISPHAPIFREVVGINMSPLLKGDLGSFRAGNVRYMMENDLDLAREINKQAAELGMTVVELTETEERQYGISLRLDHGVVVPLYFLRKAGLETPLVHVSMALGEPQKLYLFGVAVRRAAEALGRRTALLASGDMSHGLTRDAPSGYMPRGKDFDSLMVRLLAVPDVEGIVKMDPELVAQAGECGYHSVVMMLGALDGYDVNAEVISYEGPFGVGYLVASLEPAGANPEKSLLKKMRAAQQTETSKRRAAESYLVKIARNTLESYVSGSAPTALAEVPEEFREKAGVFVSIKKHGNLRGCIGTTQPTRSNIAEEVAANAISAGINDPRFEPVRKDELGELEYSVDVLQTPEIISGLHELDPARYGVIVRSGRRSGLLLPDLEGIDTPEEQVDIARRKAGIGPDEPVKLARFEVIRYK